MPYAAGQCRGCGKDPEPGRTRCKACAAAKRQQETARREARRTAGLCVKCGAPVARTKQTLAGRGKQRRVREPSVYCANCLGYFAERQRE
jgi:hypothetical protein